MMKSKVNHTPKRPPVLITGSIDLTKVIPIREKQKFSTPFGVAEGYKSDHCWVIQRHGADNRTPPHRINHQANLAAAKEIGSFVVAIGSVGSIDPDAPPGALAIPDDIFAPIHIDTICSDEERIHVVPEFDARLRKLIVDEFSFAEIEFIDGGTYAQTTGPRFESRAEITWLGEYAHFVGMTCASELTIACELQLPYALLVSVDNWANGLGQKPLTMEEFLMGVATNHERVCAAVEVLLPALKRAGENGLGSAS